MVPLIKDAAGNLLDFGVDKHQWKWHAKDGAPTWFTIPTDANATITRTDHTTGRAGLSINFTGATNIAFRLPSGAYPLTDNLRAVLLTAKAIRGYPTSIQFRISPASAGSVPNKQGVVAVIAGADASTAYFTRNHATNITSTYAAGRYSWIGTIDLSLLWVREAKAAYLLEGDQVVATADLSADFIEPSTFFPGFFVYGQAGREFHIGGLETTLWYD